MWICTLVTYDVGKECYTISMNFFNQSDSALQPEINYFALLNNFHFNSVRFEFK